MTWISENVLWQLPDESLGRVVADLAAHRSRRTSPVEFLHVLNPYDARDPAEREVHRRTLNSAALARASHDGSIRTVAAVQPGDEPLASGFDACALVPDPTADQPPTPRLFDILRRGGSVDVSGEFVVFTNMDIQIDTSFYGGLDELISLGAEALIVNRRTVHNWDPYDGSSMLAKFDLGDTHPGLDCFIFRRSWLNEFVASEARVGFAHVMRSLLYNLVAFADPLLVLTEVGMTYHYGDDQPWNTEAGRKWYEMNRSEASRVFEKLAQSPLRRTRLNTFVEALPKYRP